MLLANNDMVNANTGEFDPRQMFGMTNQDVFRWPALANGTQRQLLGFFVTMLEIPGVPIVFYGEEQESYVLENLANDYVFGRTPMASSRAWQLHGCYKLGETQYVDMPFNSSSYGCYDDSVSLDHRDPSHPLRNVLKRMYELRRQFPTLNDGYNLTSLSSRTYNIYLPGSDGFPSPHGIWSVYRGRTEGVQDFTGAGQENQGVWFIYQNENKTVDYTFDCQSQNKTLALISAFPANTTVKNLFYPYEEYDLEASAIRYGESNSYSLRISRCTYLEPFAEHFTRINVCLVYSSVPRFQNIDFLKQGLTRVNFHVYISSVLPCVNPGPSS
jgi:alpha-1,3-glucan synthase